MDFPITIAVPAGTTCSGTVAGQQNVFFMKIAKGTLGAIDTPSYAMIPSVCRKEYSLYTWSMYLRINRFISMQLDMRQGLWIV